jgi:hypothetical protein
LQATAHASGERWTAAQLFLAVSAIWHIPLGVIGLWIDQTFPLRGPEAERAHSEHIFGIFETNGWHSLLALLLGVVSLYFAVRSDHAREVALVIGAVHVAVVVALLMWSPSTFLLASNTADQVIHSFTAIGGLVGGLLTPRGGTDP